MNDFYSLGKDVVKIQNSLESLEQRLDRLAEGSTQAPDMKLGRVPGRQLRHPVRPKSAPIPKTTERRTVETALAINWKATDESFSRRVVTPDNRAEFVLFGFMVGTGNAAASQEIEDVIWPVVSQLNTDDRSAMPLYYYRPTNYLGNVAVVGFWNVTDAEWSWVGVEFTHVIDNPNARFSRTYDMNGELLISKFGWEPPVHFRSVNRYSLYMRYADCDREWGLGFAFDSITM